MKIVFCKITRLFFIFLTVLVAACATVKLPQEVSNVLVLAKENRPELEKVLNHYQESGDTQKFEAACFLIRNMRGKAYARVGWRGKNKKDVKFEALDYKNLDEAKVAINKLSKKHAGISYYTNKQVLDVETISAEFLINNIDQAFESWRANPWSRDISFATFCEYILPYRATNEPLDKTWRTRSRNFYSDLATKVKNPSDLNEVSKYIAKDCNKFIKFDTLYYLHPTDQSFSEMIEAKKGRCEDISNFKAYILRANAIPITADYTPFWAHRDNNHQWEVLLDKNGNCANPPKFNAAKVYRKGFSKKINNLRFQVPKGTQLPGWLAGASYSDVTAEYGEVSDVEVDLDFKDIKPQPFVYISVFNGGQWKAIHWAKVLNGKAVFTDMGRNICYIASAYKDEKLVPISAPFIVDKAGQRHYLNKEGKHSKLFIDALTPRLKNVDTGIVKQYTLKAGFYTLLEWTDGNWKQLGRYKLESPGVISEEFKEGKLYWITRQDTLGQARIFTIENAVQRWW